ncbi:MAG: class I SAM-dependent methyltransferase [Parvibaculum sp.]|nr:class I SAM-dependent methyltransferase [Parvibaculum sp.]
MTCIICKSDEKVFVGEKDSYKIYQCTTCKFRFVDPLPSNDELNDYYRRNKSAPYLSKADAKVARTKKRLARYKHLAPGNKFLDVGCNLGTGVKAAVELGFDAHGLDIDEESVEYARGFVPEARFHAGDISELPESFGNFDFVYSSEMIEHLPDVHAYFAALSKRMNKGAILLVTTPDAGHWSVPKDFTKWFAVIPPQHLLYFTKANMRAFLKEHDIEIIKFEFDLKAGIKGIGRKL